MVSPDSAVAGLCRAAVVVPCCCCSATREKDDGADGTGVDVK